MRGVYSTYDATKCRRHILDNFSQFKTVLRYKKLFEALFIGKKSTHSEPTDRLSHVDFLSENFSTFSPFPVRPKNIGSSLEAVSDGRLVDINKPLKDRLNGNLLFFDMLRCELVLYRCKSNYSLVLVADLNLYGVSHWGVFNGKISILPERGEKAWVSVLALVESPADCTSFYYMLKDQSIIARKKNGNEIAFTATLAGVTV